MSLESDSVKMQERRVRRACARQEMVIRKSRQAYSCNNQGAYMVLDLNNRILWGERFDATLDQIEQWLRSARINAA